MACQWREGGVWLHLIVVLNLYVINICTGLADVLAHGTSVVFINSFIDSQIFNNCLLCSGMGKAKMNKKQPLSLTC